MITAKAKAPHIFPLPQTPREMPVIRVCAQLRYTLGHVKKGGIAGYLYHSREKALMTANATHYRADGPEAAGNAGQNAMAYHVFLLLSMYKMAHKPK
ncbi:MAG: hypothetical protein ACLRMZ_01155 [Blautia marasmi]